MKKIFLSLSLIFLFASCLNDNNSATSLSLPTTQSDTITYSSISSDSFSDYFNGYTEGDSPSNTYYTTVSGTWEIIDVSGNLKLQEISGTSTGIIYQKNFECEDGYVIAKVKSQSLTEEAGLIARYKDSSNYYTLFLDDSKIKLKKKVNGSWTTLADASFSFTTSTTYTLKLELSGTSLKGYINDTLYIEATDSSLTSGYFGMRTNKNPAIFDGFQIYVNDSSSSSSSNSDYSSGVLRTVTVSSASELSSALSNAKAGDKIVLQAGTYNDNFKITANGTKDNPIWIVSENSSNKAIIKGNSTSSGVAFTATGDYIIIDSLKITNGKKGIILDNSNHSIVDNCEVYNIGEEGIHVRDGSKYVTIQNSYVHDTGLVTIKYGEGIYVGSDYKKWTSNGGNYDADCDYTQILNNTIGPNVTAEHIDIKEGVTGTIVDGNTFNGVGISDTTNGGTSFIDVKGNTSTISNNYGYQNGNDLIENAFEVHDAYSGWGDNNTFYNNTIEFDSDNYDSYVVQVGDISSISGSPDNTTAYDNTRTPSNGNMYDLK
ncbi:MAG: hypothetical protein PWP46_1206 [Fusobacteriaceae bacterium]|nr:hypothetical protein [Fusobacteriaceae bacterium]